MKEEIKALSDRVKDAKKKADNAAQEQKNLEQEVAKSLMGKSRFNPEMLSRLIEEASQKKERATKERATKNGNRTGTATCESEENCRRA